MRLKGDHNDLIKLYIDLRSDIFHRDNYGRTPLHYAAMAGSKHNVDLLLSFFTSCEIGSSSSSWFSLPAQMSSCSLLGHRRVRFIVFGATLYQRRKYHVLLGHAACCLPSRRVSWFIEGAIGFIWCSSFRLWLDGAQGCPHMLSARVRRL